MWKFIINNLTKTYNILYVYFREQIGGLTVNIMTISSARADLFKVVQTAIDAHEPVIMTSKHGNVVLMSEEDYKAIQETLHLQSIPDFVKEVREGLEESKTDLGTRDDLPW